LSEESPHGRLWECYRCQDKQGREGGASREKDQEGDLGETTLLPDFLPIYSLGHHLSHVKTFGGFACM